MFQDITTQTPLATILIGIGLCATCAPNFTRRAAPDFTANALGLCMKDQRKTNNKNKSYSLRVKAQKPKEECPDHRCRDLLPPIVASLAACGQAPDSGDFPLCKARKGNSGSVLRGCPQVQFKFAGAAGLLQPDGMPSWLRTMPRLMCSRSKEQKPC